MKMLGFFVFLLIWVSACMYVDLVATDLSNAWVMAIGVIAAEIGWFAQDYISK